MSFDEEFIVTLVRALRGVKLEAIVVGSTAGVLQGAPIVTQDVDLLVRDTPLNRRKLDALARVLGAARPRPIGDLTNVVRMAGLTIDIDFLFNELTPALSFEVIRSRAQSVILGDTVALVASLDDIIVAKETANRPKDIAQLPILRATADVLRLRQ